MRYIDFLKADYAAAVRQWRLRYRSMTEDEWAEAVNIGMKYAGKKQWVREPDIYEQEILARIVDRWPQNELYLLDAGCGFGYLLNRFFEMGFRHLYGMDLAEICVEICKERFRNKQPHPVPSLRPGALTACKDGELEAVDLGVDIKVDIQKGDLHVTGYMAESFDIVTCTEVLEHDREPLGIIDEIYRLLKPGGVAYFSMPNLNRRMAWGHINLFYAGSIPKPLPTKEDVKEFVTIEVNELFASSKFKKLAGSLIADGRFWVFEGEKV